MNTYDSKIFKINTNRSNLIPTTNLKELILNLLKNILPGTEAEKYVSDDYMFIWIRAFTNETYDPTYNYEDDEYIGDRVLKIVFPKYVMLLNPDYTPMDISNIDMLVMEKKNQYDLSYELGFLNFILIPNQPSVGVGGDVFESFFGALDKVSDLIMDGLGLINCYNMIDYIFNQNTIPDYLRYGNPKMIVEQIFIQLGLSIQPQVIKESNQFVASLKLNKEQLDFFYEHNIDLPLIIGEGRANSKKAAFNVAYTRAKDTLERNKVNTAFIERIKQERKKEMVEKPKVEKEVNKIDMNIKDLVLLLLSPIISQPYVLNKFVEEKYMNLWYKVFDESDYNQAHYEKLYFFGEILIKGLVAKKLTVMYEEYNKEDYNNILSNIVQNYDLFLVDDYDYLKGEHVLEAFMGAVEYISHELLPGSGFINCNYLVRKIFKKELIPYEYRYTHPKTVLEQLFSPFLGLTKSKPVVDYHYDEEESLHTFKLSLTNEQFDFLNKHGFKIKNKKLSESTGQLKNVTQKQAYNEALLTLEKYDINKQSMNKIKIKLDFMHPKLAMYYNQLEQKRIKDGYDYLYFASPIKTKTLTDVTIQLVGVKNGKKTILSSIIENSNIDVMLAKVELIKNYIK